MSIWLSYLALLVSQQHCKSLYQLPLQVGYYNTCVLNVTKCLKKEPDLLTDCLK